MLFRSLTTQEQIALGRLFETLFNRLPENDWHYFQQWVKRYEKGTIWCYSDLNSRRKIQKMIDEKRLGALETDHWIQYNETLEATT